MNIVFTLVSVFLQENKVSVWSIGDQGRSDLEDGFEGDPQLLCEYNHDGDVLDLQVKREKKKTFHEVYTDRFASHTT